MSRASYNVINTPMSHNTPDPHIPYCYFIGWSKLQKFYYGVKFGTDANPDTFWKNYFTSSVLIKQYRTRYGEPDIIQIRKIFNPLNYKSVSDAQHAAIKYESTVIRRLKMVSSNNFLNCSNNVSNRTGERITNHVKYRREKFEGNYHSAHAIEFMREHNRVYSKNNNRMHDPEVKQKHLDSIAKKIGYESHSVYLKTICNMFEQYKTVKGVSDASGHSQYAIRHLLLDFMGKTYVDNIRRVGFKEVLDRRRANVHNRKKKDQSGKSNGNAYVWIAISPTGQEYILMGNKYKFCKDNKILKNSNWVITKICKVRDYNP